MRDDIIKLATEIWETDKWTDVQLDRLERFYDLAVQREREACAKVCGRFADEALVTGDEDAVMCFEEAEDAIRARGQA